MVSIHTLDFKLRVTHNNRHLQCLAIKNVPGTWGASMTLYRTLLLSSGCLLALIMHPAQLRGGFQTIFFPA